MSTLHLSPLCLLRLSPLSLLRTSLAAPQYRHMAHTCQDNKTEAVSHFRINTS